MALRRVVARLLVRHLLRPGLDPARPLAERAWRGGLAVDDRRLDLLAAATLFPDMAGAD